MLLSAIACGWTLNRRKMVQAPEPCESSCDDGHNANCDAADEDGDFTLSCDEHPTTSCDADCSYSPPPPLAPWDGNGTYPASPPSPPPDTAEPTWPLALGLCIFLVALVVLLCVCCRARNYRYGKGSRMARVARCFCCCGFFFREAEPDDVFDPDDANTKPENETAAKLRLEFDAAEFKARKAKAERESAGTFVVRWNV